MAAETLYLEQRLSVNDIAQRLRIAKSTLYSYLRHRGVEVSNTARRRGANRPS